MSILKQAHLVYARKEGRWMYYQLADKQSPPAVKEAIAWVKKSLSRNERIREDVKHLKKILKTDRELLCKRQTRSSAHKTG
jgi:DNA-binding transcriptional ArsR family regulator